MAHRTRVQAARCRDIPQMTPFTVPNGPLMAQACCLVAAAPDARSWLRDAVFLNSRPIMIYTIGKTTRNGSRHRTTLPRCQPTVSTVSPRPPPMNLSSTMKPTSPQPAPPFTMSSRPYPRPSHSPRADRGDICTPAARPRPNGGRNEPAASPSTRGQEPSITQLA
jgi:hypothetical protein